MPTEYRRREFLKSFAASITATGVGVSALSSSRGVLAAPATPTPELIPVEPDIESTVRLIEDTSRERIIPVMVQ